MKKVYRKSLSALLILVLILSVSGCNGVVPSSETPLTSEENSVLTEENEKEQLSESVILELNKFLESGNEGLFISMYDISNVSEEIFSINRGVPTYLVKDTVFDSFDSLMAFMEALSQNPEAMAQLHNLILGIDPEILALDPEKETVFTQYATAFSAVRTEVIYSVHPYDHWSDEDEKLEEQLSAYETCIRHFYRHFPAEQYFYTAELFILGNKDCFEDGKDVLCDNVANKMLLYSLCDGGLKIDTQSFPAEKKKLKKNLNYIREKALPLDGVFKDETVIFLGDSIFGHYTHPTSIPSIFNELTGAESINCGVGGMSLIHDDKYYRVDTLLRALTLDDPQSKTDYEVFKKSYIVQENAPDFEKTREYLHSEGDGVTVFIEFGINDYLFAYPATDFINAYDDLCTELEANPNIKRIIPALPAFPAETIGMSGKVNVENSGGIVEDYRDAIRVVCDKHGFDFLDLAMIPEFSEDKDVYILPDGIHYNENGRYIIARRMAEYLTRYNDQ